MADDKECFFIAPIGDEGSDARERSDKLMEYIVEKAVSDYGYSVTRADQMDEPGSITDQIIQETTDSDLVIADLTGHNPNVFYELAVRHATGEPYIQLIESTESIPFDLNDLRTIKYGLDVQEADQARQKIRSQLESLENGDPEFDNPISKSAEMQSLRESTDPTDQNLAQILETLSRLDRKVDQLEADTYPPQRTLQETVEDATHLFKFGDKELEVTGHSVPKETVETLVEQTDMEFAEIYRRFKEQGIDVV